MKAWLVRAKDEVNCAVVFAETRGKARAYAFNRDFCDTADFVDIEVRRAPTIDKYYTDGKNEMDWYDPKDRLALVKELGFYCEEPNYTECKTCVAKNDCEYMREREENA